MAQQIFVRFLDLSVKEYFYLADGDLDLLYLFWQNNKNDQTLMFVFIGSSSILAYLKASMALVAWKKRGDRVQKSRHIAE